jgi:hypothetical protein
MAAFRRFITHRRGEDVRGPPGGTVPEKTLKRRG